MVNDFFNIKIAKCSTAKNLKLLATCANYPLHEIGCMLDIDAKDMNRILNYAKNTNKIHKRYKQH